MLKEGVRLDRVRGGRQKYRNRMRIVGQASINRSESYNSSIEGRRESDQGYHISSLPYHVGGEDKIPVPKTLEENKMLVALTKCEESSNIDPPEPDILFASNLGTSTVNIEEGVDRKKTRN